MREWRNHFQFDITLSKIYQIKLKWKGDKLLTIGFVLDSNMLIIIALKVMIHTKTKTNDAYYNCFKSIYILFLDFFSNKKLI
jgi:hypothetical protein